MPKTERRIKKRVDAEFEIRYIHDEEYLISFSKDISVDGMFIRTKTPPPIGKTIQIKFAVGELEPMDINARVVWVTTSSASPKDYGMGIQFIKLPKKVKEAILKIVNRIAVLEKHDGAY